MVHVILLEMPNGEIAHRLVGDHQLGACVADCLRAHFAVVDPLPKLRCYKEEYLS